MKKAAIILTICLLVFSSCKLKDDTKIKLTHTAQSGVFIQSDQNKIMIDAVFRSHPKWVYPSPSKGLLDSLESGIEPYNDIDIYFVTHAHVDHFNSRSLEKALLSNPNSIILTTPNVQKSLKTHCNNYTQIKERVISPMIEYGDCLDTIIQGIPIKIDHLKHFDDIQWPDMVYAFLIDLNGKKILHNAGSTGYFLSEYKKIRYDSIGVDVAILSKDFLNDSGHKGKEVIDNYIKPKNILIGHITDANEQYIDSLKMINANKYPNMDVMKKEGEFWIY